MNASGGGYKPALVRRDALHGLWIRRSYLQQRRGVRFQEFAARVIARWEHDGQRLLAKSVVAVSGRSARENRFCRLRARPRSISLSPSPQPSNLDSPSWASSRLPPILPQAVARSDLRLTASVLRTDLASARVDTYAVGGVCFSARLDRCLHQRPGAARRRGRSGM